jgi:hypothetical protein
MENNFINVTTIQVVEGPVRVDPELHQGGPKEVLELLEILEVSQIGPDPPRRPNQDQA